MPAGACAAGADPHLALSGPAGISQQAVPVFVLWASSGPHAGSGADPGLCEPVICLMLTGQENIFNLLSPGG